MTQQHTDRLTTADMASAGEQRGPSASSSPPPAQMRPPEEPARSSAQADPLFSSDDTQGFRSRWDDIQTGFVDEPRRAVEQADTLVAEVMKRLAEIFANERTKLEGQWSRGDNISTEDLRLALQRYRSFFDRLLSYAGQDVAPRPTGAAGAPVPQRYDTTPAQRTPMDQPSGMDGERWEVQMPRFREWWAQRHGGDASQWAEHEPAYRYGWEMAHQAQYQGREWREVEPDLRRDWEVRYPDWPWDRAAEAIREAWESVVGATSRR